MKTVLLVILIFFSCIMVTTAQKKYLAKIQTLNGRWQKGILMKVDSNGVFILSKKMGWNSKDPKISFERAKFYDFREIKFIKIRKKNSTDKGVIIGATIGLLTSIVAANIVIENYNRNYQPTNSIISTSSPGLNAFAAYFTLVPFLTSGGGGIGGLIGGHFPNKYKVDNRSLSFKDLITELKKYEWYHAEKDTLIIK